MTRATSSTPIECPRRAPPVPALLAVLLARRSCWRPARPAGERRIRRPHRPSRRTPRGSATPTGSSSASRPRLRASSRRARLVRDPLPPPRPATRGRGAADPRRDEARADRGRSVPVLILAVIAAFVFYKLPGIKNVPTARAGELADRPGRGRTSSTGSSSIPTGRSRSTGWSCPPAKSCVST